MPEDFFDADSTVARLAAEALAVDVDGFEGPLDLLLTLARSQKVDLRRVSILRLAEQYLGFVEAAKRLRIELAADYLVMAAWLAYLKSRLRQADSPYVFTSQRGERLTEAGIHHWFRSVKALARQDEKGRDAALVAIEMANLVDDLG